MAKVVLEKVEKRYAGNAAATVRALDLEIDDGEFLVLVGSSGCGKSTVLRMIAGLIDVTGGRIFIDGADVTRRPPKDRDVSMVFQNYALFPHMDVSDNIGFGLGSDSTVNLRGIVNSARSNVLVLIDGVRQNRITVGLLTWARAASSVTGRLAKARASLSTRCATRCSAGASEGRQALMRSSKVAPKLLRMEIASRGRGTGFARPQAQRPPRGAGSYTQ